MCDSLRNESEVEDLDYLLEDSCSQPSYSQPDLDAILRPLSDSQQEREAILDQRDQDIMDRLQGGREEGDQEEGQRPRDVNFRHIKRRPPGLPILTPNCPLRFSFSDLNLESDLSWGGRARVLKSGFSPSMLDKMLGPENRLLFVRYLAPETGQTNMVAGEQEFQQVVDFVFYLATVTTDRLVFRVLEKCLFDLLKSSGYSWKLSCEHLFTCLLNLGTSEQAVLSPQFYQFLNLSQTPSLATFYSRRGSGRQLDLKTRQTLIHNTLYLVSELLTMPDRSSLLDDKAGLLPVLHLVTTLAQDQTLIDDPLTARQVTLTLHSLLPRADLLDTAELLSTGFMPGQLLPVSHLPWDYSRLPSHFSQGGINHPHNMLFVCSLLPHSAAGSRLRQLLAYLNIQLVLGTKEVDLPVETSLTDLLLLFEDQRDLWGLTEDLGYYSMYCMLALMDQMFCSLSTSLQTEQVPDLRRLTSLLEDYFNKLPKTDPLDLDPVTVADMVAEMISRWKLEISIVIERSENDEIERPENDEIERPENDDIERPENDEIGLTNRVV